MLRSSLLVVGKPCWQLIAEQSIEEAKAPGG